MFTEYNAKHYPISDTAVSLKTEDTDLQYVFDECEKLCLDNTRVFGDMPVIREGAKYNGLWLETQPMGGEMYACRNMEIALNNHLIFMKYQRRDGKMPGMITYSLPFRGISANHDWMQGDFFTRSAMRMYYLIGKDKEYLKLLYETLKNFENYLWKYRDSDGNGCLETFCIWDTGDDNNTKMLFRGVHSINHGLCFTDTPPTDHGGMPFESAEYMAYSYSHCCVLAEISDILDNGEGNEWREKADKIRKRATEYLWDSEKKAFFDRDKDNETIDVLSLENIKCMYHGLFTQEMADDFIEKHLLNPEEFFTPLPLPNIAANDPVFYVNDELNNFTPEIENVVRANMADDIADNSWSGPVQGLIYQRAIDGLLNYGHHAELTYFGRKWLANLAKVKKFGQQFNPFTGEPSPGATGYGPTVLSALEYITHLIGIDYANERLTFSSGKNEKDSEFNQLLFGDTYLLKRQNGTAYVYKNGDLQFSFTSGARVICDTSLKILNVIGIEPSETPITVTVGNNAFTKAIVPNEVCSLTENGLTTLKKVRFDMK